MTNRAKSYELGLRRICVDPKAKASERLEACKLLMELDRWKREDEAKSQPKSRAIKAFEDSIPVQTPASVLAMLSAASDRENSQQTAQNQ